MMMEEMSKTTACSTTGEYISSIGPVNTPEPTVSELSGSLQECECDIDGGRGDVHVELEVTKLELTDGIQMGSSKGYNAKRPKKPPPPPPLKLNSQDIILKVEHPAVVQSEDETELDDDDSSSSPATIQLEGHKWTTWAGGFQAKLALFVLAMNSFILTRFPVEISNGSVLVAYVLLMFLVIQPLVYFELLLGQLYLRPLSFRRITETDLFGRVASGLRTATILAAFLFLPSQLVSLNYAALLAWDISNLKDENYSRTSCYNVLHSIDGRDEWTSESFGINWRLIFPSLATLAIITLATIRGVPNLLAKFLVWLILPCFLGLVYILRQQLIEEKSTIPYIYSRLSLDLNAYSDLSMWATASKLALLTSGVGLGILSTISSSNPLHFHQLYLASWIHVIFISTVGIIATVCTFGEIEFITDLHDMVNLPLLTFGSKVCRSPSQIYWWFALVFGVFQFILNSWPKILASQGFIATYTPFHFRWNNDFCKKILLILTGPLIVICFESVYMLPVAKHILHDTDFFCGAWTMCGLTLLRVLAFVYNFNVDQLCLHVSQQIHRSNKLSPLFVIQLKYLLLPALLGMFILLSVGIMEGLLPNSWDPEYPDWLKAIGCVLNALSIMTIVLCVILDLCGDIWRSADPPPSPPGPPRRITISSPQLLTSTRLAIRHMRVTQEEPRPSQPQFGSFKPANVKRPRIPPPPPPKPPRDKTSPYGTDSSFPTVPPPVWIVDNEPPPPPLKPLHYAESLIYEEPDFPPPPPPLPTLILPTYDSPVNENVVIETPDSNAHSSIPVSASLEEPGMPLSQEENEKQIHHL